MVLKELINSLSRPFLSLSSRPSLSLSSRPKIVNKSSPVLCHLIYATLLITSLPYLRATFNLFSENIKVIFSQLFFSDYLYSPRLSQD